MSILHDDGAYGDYLDDLAQQCGWEAELQRLTELESARIADLNRRHPLGCSCAAVDCPETPLPVYEGEIPF